MKTALVIAVCVGLLIVACAPKAPPAEQAQPSGDVSDNELNTVSNDIASAGTDGIDTSGLDTLDSDLDAISAADV